MLDGLKGADGPTKLDARLGVVHRHLQYLLRPPHHLAALDKSCPLQSLEQGFPATSGHTKNVLPRHRHVSKLNLGLGKVGDAFQRGDGNPGAVGLNYRQS